MLANRRPAECHWQESYRGEAVDMVEVMRLSAKTELNNGGSYQEDCLETKEWSPLEHGAIEQEIYAEGVRPGLNFEHHEKRVRNELISLTPHRS
jgi:hypothetical protein